MNDTIALMRRHRSIRRYRPEPIPDEHIRQAVLAGQAASTSSAVQAYSLLRVRDEARRRTLVALTGNQPMVAACGAFFVVCGDTRRHRLLARRAGRPFDSRLEGFLVAAIDASLFAQNLVLAFESMGYGACYVGGLRNRLVDVQALLQLPEGLYPFFGLCVGVPDQDPPARPRLPVEAVLFDEQYPDDETVLRLIEEYDEAYRDDLERRGAPAGTWSDAMAGKFTTERRPDLVDYYRAQGAEMG